MPNKTVARPNRVWVIFTGTDYEPTDVVADQLEDGDVLAGETAVVYLHPDVLLSDEVVERACTAHGREEAFDQQDARDRMRAAISAALTGDHRDEAVQRVDARHGYTVELSHSPEAHRAEYDAEEDALSGERP